MPKQKSSSTARKRFKMRKSGLITRNTCNHRHNTGKKSTKVKLRLKSEVHVSKADQKNIKKLITA